MRWLIRMLLITGELLLTVFITILLVSPATVHGWIDVVSELNLIIRRGIVIAINLIFFRIILNQLKIRKVIHTDNLIVKVSGVVADISVESVRKRVIKAVHGVPNVSLVDTKVRAKGGRVDVDLQVVMTGTQINIPKKQKEVYQVVKKLLTEQLGLRLAGKPRVHIRLEGDDTNREVIVQENLTTSSQIEKHMQANGTNAGVGNLRRDERDDQQVIHSDNSQAIES
jgi:hypothetical protein